VIRPASRPPTRHAALAAALLLALALAPAPAPAAKSEAEARAELAKIRERIRKITEDVQEDVARRDGVARELREADRSVAGARSRLDDVREARTDGEQRRAKLRAEKARTSAALDAEREALAAQVRAAYVGGRDEQLKVVLNAGDPATLGRMLAYYSYFGRARAAAIERIREQLRRLDALDQELAAEEAKLAELEQRRREEVGALDAARERREKALDALQARIASRNVQLRELRANAQSVERLVEKLRAAIAESAAGEFRAPPGGRRFDELRGRLPWPARGRVVANFGQERAAGLRWSGVLIETAPGAAVRAPYHGRVVYADWLTGLGQLVILDHGGGWLSLDGTNERLRTEVGARGPRPELYFEIRRGGRPVDPRPFLQGAARR
jgi:septal ring factor EnvC (AmiA/AmiB activator)